MAIRQYIGARYVPKFYDNPNGTSEWLPNVIYEPLTIVTYDSNSYTSKKTVPASVGIPANNPEYWVATGNYNAFINEINDDIGTINNNIDTINDNIDTINNNIDTINDRIDNINPERNEYIIIGDSWSVTNDDMYVDILPSLLPDGYVQHLYSVGGAPVQQTATPNFNTLVTQCIADTTINADKLNTIILFGGVNDYKQNTTESDAHATATAFISYINRLKVAFPKVRIIVILNAVYYITNTQWNYFNIIRNDLKETCETYYAGEWLNFSEVRTTDFIHPTLNGSNTIAVKVANIINGGGPDQSVNNRTSINFHTTDGGYFSLLIGESFAGGTPLISYTLRCVTKPTTTGTDKHYDFTVNRDGTVTAGTNVTIEELDGFTSNENVFLYGTLQIALESGLKYVSGRQCVAGLFTSNATLGTRKGLESVKFNLWLSDTNQLIDNLLLKNCEIKNMNLL